MSTAIKLTQLNLYTNPATIDYFKIPINTLKNSGFNVTYINLNLSHNKLNPNALQLNINEVETICLNIQVGLGKSTAFYKLVKEHVSYGHFVIMVSPYKKLVEKDTEAIKQQQISVTSYDMLNENSLNISSLIKSQVQIMTVNCLLQNPGDDAFVQSFIKRKYLNSLIEHYKKHSKKVVIFFDEIHDSVKNFIPTHVPNIFKWNGLVHKCYIASATYTPASIPVIKFIGLLTQKKIKVYESDRVIVQSPCKLKLYLTNGEISPTNLSLLNPIVNIIKTENSRINILTGYKSLTSALIKNKTDIGKALKNLNLNIVTSEQENRFDINRNNIGTSFKTGIDIPSGTSLIIVVPPISNTNQNYGIFSDGIPSIIQSFARVRESSNIHVFIPLPKVILEKGEIKPEIPAAFAFLIDENYKFQNDVYNFLEAIYSKLKSEKDCEINIIENAQRNNTELGFSYPSFENHLIYDSQNLILKQFYYGGKELSPYILWAALNNQFTNAILEEVHLVEFKSIDVKLTSKSLKTDIANVLLPNISIFMNKSIHELTRESLSMLFDPNIYNNTTPLVSLDGKRILHNDAIRNPALVMETFNLALQTKHAVNTEISKNLYILALTLNSINTNKKNKLASLYTLLNTYINKYFKSIKLIPFSNDYLIDKDEYLKMDNKHLKRFEALIITINKEDFILKNKAVQFLPNINKTLPIESRKRAIYKAIKKAFTNITSIKKTYNGLKDQYRLVTTKLQKDLPNDLQNHDIY